MTENSYTVTWAMNIDGPDAATAAADALESILHHDAREFVVVDDRTGERTVVNL